MKLQENNTQHIEIIARYLSGEMGNLERKEFEASSAEDSESSILIEQMKRDWTLMEQYKNSKKVNTNSAWERLHSRFQEEQLIPDQEENPRVSLHKPVMQWAAIFVGIVALGSLFFYLNSSKSTPQLLTLNTTSEDVALIKTLKDGSVVYIANNSSFSFPELFADKERKVELTGEAFFDIARNPEKPFVIETSSATVEVLGTAFNVKANKNNGFELIVERGKVRVTPKSGSAESFLVVAGEKLSCVNNHFQKENNTDNSYRAWRTNRMRFKDEPLTNIIKVLNEKYHSNITLEGNGLASRKLTVTFENSSLDTMLEVISLTLNVKHEKVTDKIILHEVDGKNNK